MVTNELIEKYNLIKTPLVIGGSFANDIPVYEFRDYPELYVMACDTLGAPLKEGVVMLFVQGGGVTFAGVDLLLHGHQGYLEQLLTKLAPLGLPSRTKIK